MRTVVCTVVLAVVLGAFSPVDAQLRSEVPEERAPVKVFDERDGFSLNELFSPEHFRMNHSYAMSFSSMGGNGQTLGQYTNTMRWQFNNQLAARVDVAFMHAPFGNQSFSPNANGLGGKIYLRNAEIAYRPTENTQFRFSVRQSPYGSYMSPYGYSGSRYGGYGYYDRYSRFDRFGGYGSSESLFWNDELNR